jgi:hypothetical protein
MVTIRLVASVQQNNQPIRRGQLARKATYLKGFVRFLMMGILATMADWKGRERWNQRRVCDYLAE